MSGLILAAVLALSPQASLSGSTDARTEADFRCYGAALMMASMVEEGDEDMLNAAGLLGFYYLGRLEGREPNVNWIARGVRIEDAKAAMLLGELERCGREFEAKSREMISAGEGATGA